MDLCNVNPMMLVQIGQKEHPFHSPLNMKFVAQLVLLPKTVKAKTKQRGLAVCFHHRHQQPA